MPNRGLPIGEVLVPTRQQKQLKVADLFNSNLQAWNWTALVQFAGLVLALNIRDEHVGLILKGGIRDKLMFTWATNGEFSVKRVYQMIQQSNPIINPTVTDEDRKLWKTIWKLKSITPRVQMFIWKSLNGALPTGAESAKRLQGFPSACQLCQCPVEDVMHEIFLCPHSSATWFSWDFALKQFQT